MLPKLDDEHKKKFNRIFKQERQIQELKNEIKDLNSKLIDCNEIIIGFKDLQTFSKGQTRVIQRSNKKLEEIEKTIFANDDRDFDHKGKIKKIKKILKDDL